MIYLWSVASDLLVSREGWHGCLDFLKIDVVKYVNENSKMRIDVFSNSFDVFY